jgi:Icc-related predicted phosphoesterase
MKILAAGDIHGDIDQVKALAMQAKSEDVDLVVLSGDLTMGEMHTQGLIGPFKKVGKKVVLVPGNHETLATADFLAELYGVKNLHGYSIYMGDVGIFGAGSANIGLFQLPENEITAILKKGFDRIKDVKTKIMVTHVHPDKTLMSKFSENLFPGSVAVRRFIEQNQPDIAICSHVHEAEGIEENIGKTKVINVGKKGRIIEV